MPITVISGRFPTAFLPTGISISRLLSVKFAAHRRVDFVSRSARASSASFSVETNSSVDSVIEKENKREEKNTLACPICYSSVAGIS